MSGKLAGEGKVEGEWVEVVGPGSGRVVGSVCVGSVEDVGRAVGEAEKKKGEWGRSLAAERELVLLKAAEVLEGERADVVKLLIEETGSTFGKAQFEVSFTVNMLRAVAGEARRIQGEVIPADVPGMMSMAVRKP